MYLLSTDKEDQLNFETHPNVKSRSRLRILTDLPSWRHAVSCCSCITTNHFRRPKTHWVSMRPSTEELRAFGFYAPAAQLAWTFYRRQFWTITIIISSRSFFCY